ncbi:MAG: acetyl-CoA carboxylase biotin carboxyl carrier protein [Terrisporobacter sp.]|uniref:acetyl-CoA carboxylase biotin carboxyl carrier protein n=1 Tax=Terrisporobacter sp. TaxID=1965305 RepID=UPI002FC666C4
MNFSEIKELIELINKSDLSYLEIQNEKDYIKMDKSISRNYTNNNDSLDKQSINKLSLGDENNRAQFEELPSSIKGEVNNSNKDEITLSEENEDDFDYIKSPIVGTFYKSVSPESDPFVNIGEKITKGQVVCIIEAMKLMNEITAEYDCEIIDVLSGDGKMVEYGSSLFKIRRV